VGVGDFINLSALDPQEVLRMTYLGWVQPVEIRGLPVASTPEVAEIAPEPSEADEAPVEPKPKRGRPAKAKPVVEPEPEIIAPLADEIAPLPDEQRMRR